MIKESTRIDSEHAVARRQLRRELLDLRHRLAGGHARDRRALQLHRRHTVVAVEALRAIGPGFLGEVREGHQISGGVAHPPLLEVRGGRAAVCLALDVDPLDPAIVVEVVHVLTSPGDRQRVADIGRGYAHRAGGTPVDVEVELRRVLQPRGADRGDQRALRGHAQQLVARQ